MGSVTRPDMIHGLRKEDSDESGSFLADGPRKTLYNRFQRWAAKGIWSSIFNALANASEPSQCGGRKKCMVRPVRARVRDIVDDDSSCINVSGLSRVDCCCSQAMMRSAHAVPNKWFGHEARFFAQGLRHADPLFRHRYSRALQSRRKLQENAGSLRS
jgi:hypothetical protein